MPTAQIFQHPENVKISIFPLHCISRNAIFSKVLKEFSKSFFWLKDEEGGYCGQNWHVHSHFPLAIATWPLSNIQKMKNFNFFPLHCPSRNAITSKVFNEFPKNFCAWKMRKVAIVVENFKFTDILVLQ